VRGNVELHRGRLDLALSLWKDASLKGRVDHRSEDARERTWSLLRAYGIEEAACCTLVKSHLSLGQHVIDAAKALATCGSEYRHRRRYEEASACYEATLRLADHFERATRDVIGLTQAAYVRSLVAGDLVELALMRGDREAAERFVAVAEENGRTAELLQSALTRALDADPLLQASPGLERPTPRARPRRPGRAFGARRWVLGAVDGIPTSACGVRGAPEP
jgi:hypothetical protein